MFCKIGCLWTWTKASGNSMNMDQHHTGPGQCHGVKKASELSKGYFQAGSVSGNRSRFSCYCGQDWDFQHNLLFTLRRNSAKLLYTVKLNSIFMTHTHPYIWSWVWPLLVLDDRSTPVVQWGVTSHSSVPHRWKQNIIHPGWVLLRLWQRFWENNLSYVTRVISHCTDESKHF